MRTENEILKSQNEDLQQQLDELNAKFNSITAEIKNLQETNNILLDINEEFGRENDQLKEDIKKCESELLKTSPKSTEF